jgi:hypothetical protein
MMSRYLQQQYHETKSKYTKFSARLERSQKSGEFQRYNKDKQHFLISRVKKLWERLRVLEVRLKLTTAGASLAMILLVSNVNGQEQFVLSQAKNPLPPPSIMGEDPWLIDVDNDGDLDLILEEYEGISLFRNTGTPEAPVFVKAEAESNPFNEINGSGYFRLSSLFGAADLDADGDIDYVSAGATFINTGSNENILLFGTYSYLPYGSTIADLDDDGDVDILRSYYDSTLIVYKNTGVGPIIDIDPEWDSLNISNWPYEESYVMFNQLVDYDNDGDFDLIMNTMYAVYDTPDDYSINRTIVYIENTGTVNAPSFVYEEENQVPFNGLESESFAIGDLDDDTDMDLLLFSEYSLQMLRYYELEESTYLENEEVFPELYDGILIRPSVIPPEFVDLDDDGDLDILTWNYYTGITYLEHIDTEMQKKYRVNDEFPLPFLDGSTYIQIPFFVDLDKDGDRDVFRLDYDGDVYYKYLENTGTNASPVYSTVDFPALIGFDDVVIPAFADLDGDGDLDMAFTVVEYSGDYSGSVFTKYYESTGNDPLEFNELTGTDNPLYFVNENNYDDLREYQKPMFLDVDEEGDLDAAFLGEYAGIYFFENAGGPETFFFREDGSHSPFPDISNMGYSSSINFVDYDGDGDKDLFVNTYYGQQMFYYENTGGPGVGLLSGIVEPIEIFPNPAKDKITITSLSDIIPSGSEYEILTINGQGVLNGELSGIDDQIHHISIESLEAGHYLLKIEGDKKNYISKFLKL